MAQTKIGIVHSNKMQNTIVVKVQGKEKHPFYKKLISVTRKYKAHDELSTKIGEKVKIQETKPYSKSVHFKVLERIK